MKKWSLIAAVKDEQVLQRTLLKSPDVGEQCQIIIKRGYVSAAAAYNEGLGEAGGDIVVLAHTDVYLPRGWREGLESVLEKLEKCDPNWGVLGVGGVGPSGGVEGHLYSTGLQSMLGRPFDALIPTVSLDEALLIMRRSAGLRFDENMPGFHLYGTDICLEAKRRGNKSYIVQAFCIHNSIGIRSLPLQFWQCYMYMRRKWWNELPVRTCCTEITKTCWPIVAALKMAIRHRIKPSTIGTRCADPAGLYEWLVSSGLYYGSK